MKKLIVRRITPLIGIALVIGGLLFHVSTGTLSSFGWEDIAYLCPLGALETLLATKSFIPRVVIAFVVVLVVCFALGRVFCGWVCPVPPIARFFGGRRRRVRREAEEREAGCAHQGSNGSHALGESHEAEAPAALDGIAANVASCASGGSGASGGPGADVAPAADAAPCDSAAPAATGGCGEFGAPGASSGAAAKRPRFRPDSRHGVLAAALLSSLVFGFPVFCLVCPVGLTLGLVLALWFLFTAAEVNLSLLVIPVVLVVELVVLRHWCQRLCPLGALMSLLSLPNRSVRPSVDAKKCLRMNGSHCDACVGVCAEGLDPHTSERMNDCTKCAQCQRVCPGGAISFPLLAKRSGRNERNARGPRGVQGAQAEQGAQGARSAWGTCSSRDAQGAQGAHAHAEENGENHD